MWLSKQMRPAPPTADADMGMTTIAGGQTGVMTRGEVRDLPVYGPGGYVWLPENGKTVLVIKGGPGGEEQCVSGMRQISKKNVQHGIRVNALPFVLCTCISTCAERKTSTLCQNSSCAVEPVSERIWQKVNAP